MFHSGNMAEQYGMALGCTEQEDPHETGQDMSTSMSMRYPGMDGLGCIGWMVGLHNY